jgi:hypothetical protein
MIPITTSHPLPPLLLTSFRVSDGCLECLEALRVQTVEETEAEA